MRSKLVIKEFVILGIEYYKPRKLILTNKRVLFIFISAKVNKICQVLCILQKAVSYQQKHTSPVKNVRASQTEHDRKQAYLNKQII